MCGADIPDPSEEEPKEEKKKAKLETRQKGRHVGSGASLNCI